MTPSNRAFGVSGVSGVSGFSSDTPRKFLQSQALIAIGVSGVSEINPKRKKNTRKEIRLGAGAEKDTPDTPDTPMPVCRSRFGFLWVLPGTSVFDRPTENRRPFDTLSFFANDVFTVLFEEVLS